MADYGAEWMVQPAPTHDDDEVSPPFVAAETSQRYRERLLYLTIPPKAFDQMRMQLSQAGATSTVLCPDRGRRFLNLVESSLSRGQVRACLIGPV
jgi:hypothetical protein